MRRCYGSWHRARVLGAYRRTRSLRLAAKAAGVSPGWAYSLLRREDAIARPTPAHPVRLVREAIELYQQGLSCRSVAAVLAGRCEPAPSQQWVFERVRDAGLLRSKSRAMELREARRRRRDYDRLRQEARELATERRWSPRQIARHLGVSRQFARRATPAEDRCNPRRATLRRKWEADLPDVEWRLDRDAEIVYRRRELGQAYAEIMAATGVCCSTVYLALRAAGIVKAQPSRRKGSRARYPSVHFRSPRSGRYSGGG